MNSFDASVIGAGIWGCTIARRLADIGKHVIVFEKRNKIGGNCQCDIDSETGIEIHKYGSHIFHTNNEDVWNFINRFTSFNDYKHHVLSCTKKTGIKNVLNRGNFHIYHLPISCVLLKEFFGHTIKPSEMTENERKEIFDAFIRGYTSKQWGVQPEKVDQSIISRLKIRDSYSIDYFDDKYQGIPIDGYNRMFEKMLDHPNITVKCNNEFNLQNDYDTLTGEIYYSGPIDSLLNYKFGPLPWRTLQFKCETLQMSDFQRNSVVNYPDIDVPYTRIHEFKYYHPEQLNIINKNKTVIMYEYSSEWKFGDEPYYPVNTLESSILFKRYHEEIQKINNSSNKFKIIVGGRLGQYKYFDMDKTIESALHVI